MSYSGYFNPYPYVRKTKERGVHPLISTTKYTFKDKSNSTYIINIEYYQNEIYIIKFFLKDHRSSPYKYNLLTNKWDARRVLHTCVQLGKDIYKTNSLASFGFIGSPTIDEYEKTEYAQTKRFKVYSSISTFFFSPEHFIHSFYSDKSAYILLNIEANKKNPNLLNDIVQMFDNNYVIDNLFPDLSSLPSFGRSTR